MYTHTYNYTYLLS